MTSMRAVQFLPVLIIILGLHVIRWQSAMRIVPVVRSEFDTAGARWPLVNHVFLIQCVLRTLESKVSN
jgi:hypothetical protein